MPRKYMHKYPHPLHPGFPPRSGRLLDPPDPNDFCPSCGHNLITHGARGCMECSCIDYDPEGDDQ